MFKEFKYLFSDLTINPTEIEELMGYKPGTAPEPIPELIQRGLYESPDYCDIRGGFRIFDSILTDVKKNSIQIENQCFYTGKIVANQLKKAQKAALFIGTAGSGISDHAKKVSQTDDPLMGYVFDVVGSMVAEKATGLILEKIKAEIEHEGLSLSNHFSPGYCDWSVADQQKLFSFFPNNFCGVTLSPSSLMNPIKSVSGIIGIGVGFKQTGAQCNWCNDRNCMYGKIKRQKKI
jgi:hypothetical protein